MDDTPSLRPNELELSSDDLGVKMTHFGLYGGHPSIKNKLAKWGSLDILTEWHEGVPHGYEP